MPRKKLIKISLSTPVMEEDQPKKTRRRAPTPPAPGESATPAPEQAAAAKQPVRRRSAKPLPKEAPEPAEHPEPARRRAARKVGVAATAPEPLTSTEQPGSSPARSRSRSRGGGGRSGKGASLGSEIHELADESLVLTWRAKDPGPEGTGQQPTAVQDEASGDDERKLAPRRSRTRRRRDRVDREITAAAALGIEGSPAEPAPAGEEKRTSDRVRRRPVRGAGRSSKEEKAEQPAAFGLIEETFPLPEDGPKIATIDGRPMIVRDLRVYPQIVFFGSSPDERGAATVLDEIRLASANGIHLFSHLVELVVDPSAVDDAVSFAGYLVKKTVEIDPEAQILLRVVVAAPQGWERTYPKAKFISESGGLAEPSVCDDEFWKVAEECLATFVRSVRMLGMNDHLLGVHLERGEWFFADGWGYDTSPAAHERFRDWLRTRYREDVVALRAAWFDGQVQFQTVSVPEYGQGIGAGEEFVRTGRKARRWVEYHLFLSDVTVQRIGRLAHAVKLASEGYFLVGVSYGYTFEWSHPASGHLSLGKLLRTRAIDMIAGPPSYKNREPGGSAPFPCPIDSFALNGKLYLSEEDFKTPISERFEPDDFNPVMKTPQALENVHWRGAGAAMAHSSGVCWMDLWGNGWLNTSAIWTRAAKVHEAFSRSLAAPVAEPDVAVFIDERSLAYLVDQHAFQLLVQNVREAILRSGMSSGFYLLSDLAHRERFPESKLYVFMNAWDIRPEVRSAIKARLQRDGKVLFWLYAAGLFDGGRNSLERAREVTGIALRAQPFASKPGTTILNRRHPLCQALNEQQLQAGGELVPSYFAIPEDGIVLGEYVQTGLPSFVVKEFETEGDPSKSWTSVFLGEPLVSPGLFRALGQMAGAHIWNYHEDVVHVRPPFLTVHCAGKGPRAITLPDKWSAYNLYEQRWDAVDSTHLRFQAIEGTSHGFLVGPQMEIESLLSKDPSELLTLSQIPPQPENTVEMGSILFDVPIMKLDEWVEESWSEELVDDLLLKPSLLEIDLPEPAHSGKKAGPRQRRGRSARPTEPPGPPPAPSDDDIAVSFVFRKRQ